MLAQRAVADSPRWTRAVEDQSGPIPGRERASELGEIIIMVVRRAQVGPETGHLEERNERAGALLARLMRAVKGGLVTTS